MERQIMNKVEKLNNINNKDLEDILKVWESSVREIHNFLNEFYI